MAHDTMMLYNSPNAYKVVHSEEVLELYRGLMKLDPSHSRYYKDEHSLVLFLQVILSFLRSCVRRVTPFSFAADGYAACL